MYPIKTHRNTAEKWQETHIFQWLRVHQEARMFPKLLYEVTCFNTINNESFAAKSISY